MSTVVCCVLYVYAVYAVVLYVYAVCVCCMCKLYAVCVIYIVYAVEHKCPHASSYATLLDHMRRWTRWRTFAVTLARHCGDTEADVSDHPKNYAILLDMLDN